MKRGVKLVIVEFVMEDKGMVDGDQRWGCQGKDCAQLMGAVVFFQHPAYSDMQRFSVTDVQWAL